MKLPSKKRKIWFKERFTPHEIHWHGIKKIIKKKKTKFQELVIADTYSFGRCLILDGELQSALFDERIYHETLVHIPMALGRNIAKKVLVLGGGEGATAREILRWKNLENVSMVDIDKDTVKFCMKYLSAWHKNSFFNKKVKIFYEDAYSFVKNSSEKWDVIIMDLPCPLRGGPAYKLYSVEFMRLLKKHLSPGGVLASQAGSGSMIDIDFHLAFYSTCQKVFKKVLSYQIFVPSFDVPWAFVAAAESFYPREKAWKRVEENVRGEFFSLNRETFLGVGNNPAHIKRALSKNQRIITLRNPVYYFK